jgi:nucleotide-binding universal stress UspA family protein
MEAAISAAHINGGHVTCLHARIDAVQTAAMIEMAFPQHRNEQNLLRQIGEEENTRAGRARAAFEASVAQHGLPRCDRPDGNGSVSLAWRETQAFFGEIEEEARYHDLIVMGRDPETSAERIRTVLMQAGRPLLLAPFRAELNMGRAIAIAWKAGAEAARAVTAASFWLARAERVFVLSISQNGAKDDRDRLSAERLATALRWRGIKTEVTMEYTPSGPESQALEAMACAKDCNLLVAGAYGHSRLREFVLGGVTEGLIARCDIPVLLFR